MVSIAPMAATSFDQQPQPLQQPTMVNGVPLHFAVPAAPVLTTAMGVGMGMNMNPSSMGMNMMGLGMGVPPMGTLGSVSTPAVVPQLVMAPQLTQQLMAYSTAPLYTYQQTGGIIGAVAPVATVTGGRGTARAEAA